MRVIKIGLVAGIVISNASAADNPEWFGQRLFDAFGQRLMPVLKDVGIEPGQPEILEIHNVVKR